MQENTGKLNKRKYRALLTVLLIVSILCALTCGLLLLRIFLNLTGEPVKLTATGCNEGQWMLAWSEFEKNNRYRIRVKDIGSSETSVYHAEGTEKLINCAPGKYQISIIAGTFPIPGAQKYFTDILDLTDPEPVLLKCLPDPESKSVHLFWTDSSDEYAIYDLTGEPERVSDVTDKADAYVDFGKVIGIPGLGEVKTIGLQQIKHTSASTVIGSPHPLADIPRDFLYGESLNMNVTVDEKNRVTLTWQETKGVSYELDVEFSGCCMPLAAGPIHETGYSTSSLKPNTEYTFHLRALDENRIVRAEQTVTIETGISVINTTVWLNKRLRVYSEADTERGEVLGTAEPSAMYCVLDEENGMFKIRFAGDVYGWIDSNYCMVNLPEYLGNMVSYDITNSYDSQYTFHEYEIFGLTGKLVKGYEDVRLYDGTFLAPLLYPAAQKLTAAAEDALGRGYRLRLYDTYRPNLATGAIYNIASAQVNGPLSYTTYTGNRVSLPEIGDEDRTELWYLDMVQNSGWSMNAFLAPGGSFHNMGVAADLGIEDAKSGEVLPAQTMMHDLSIFSTTYSNNQNAELLYDIMESAGLQTIRSEWWHFQDNDAQKALKPEYCRNGVSIRGWTFDGFGWKFRDAEGRTVTDDLREGDTVYSFDSLGYGILVLN